MEAVATIPVYARPLEGPFGDGLRIASDLSVQLARMLVGCNPVIVGRTEADRADMLLRNRRDRVDDDSLIMSAKVRVLVPCPDISP